MSKMASRLPRLLSHAAGRNAILTTISGRATVLSALQATLQTGHGQQQRGAGAASAAAAAVGAAGAAAAVGQLWPSQADCSAVPPSFLPPAAQESPRWLGLPRWLTGWLPGGGRHRSGGGMYLERMRDDPRVGVVMAFALPFLALSFGYQPSQAQMAAGKLGRCASKIIAPHLDHLRPWEVAVVLWGAARLGFVPPDAAVLRKLRSLVLAALREAPGSPNAFSPQEAAMAVWSLSVLQAQDAEVWSAAMTFMSRCPAGSMDEVALIHLWQAAMFTNRDVVTAAALSADTDAAMPRMRSAADEVKATLAAGGCPLPLISRCEQVYREASQQAGFDGPWLIELTMLRLLVNVHQELGDASFGLEDLRLMDLKHAKQLLEDPYLLAKFKSEVADKRSRQNNFTRTLADVSRTLRDLGLYHVVQAPVLDGLVHVDIALPDYKIAFFVDTAPRPDGRPDGGGGRLATLDPEGAMLTGYVANETPGSKQAKLHLLQQHGWVVLPLTWIENVRGEAEKRRLLLEQLDRAGEQQLMQGRVSSMLHSAMRQAEESKLGRERYDRGSAGQYITRSRPPN